MDCSTSDRALTNAARKAISIATITLLLQAHIQGAHRRYPDVCRIIQKYIAQTLSIYSSSHHSIPAKPEWTSAQNVGAINLSIQEAI